MIITSSFYIDGKGSGSEKQHDLETKNKGRPDEACKYLEEMMEKGMKAPQLDYNKFGADFSKNGNPGILEELARKMNFAGKFEVSNVLASWADMMKKNVERRGATRSFGPRM